LKIIVLGAGHTGSAVARALAKEGNDVVVVDLNSDRLRALQDRTDIATVSGAGTHPDSLIRASAEDVDLLIAVMPHDEDNMVACQVAWALFQPAMIIARIRDFNYLNFPELFSKNNIPIDVLIQPESLVTQHVQKLIEYPGVQQLHNFANGMVKLVSIDVQEGAQAMGRCSAEISEQIPELRRAGLFREGQLIEFSGSEELQAQDRLLYVVPDTQILESIALFRTDTKPYKRIILAGGGHVGQRLAMQLQNKFKVKVIEQDPDRAALIAERLDKAMVLCGNATDRDLLVDEDIADTDMYCALTSSDETNILSCMLAKKLGVRKTLCLVNKPAYVDMILHSAIDMVFSPEKITSASILRYVRKGVINVCPIQSGQLEAMEFVVEGNSDISRVVGQRLDDLSLPEGTVIGALVRGKQVLEMAPDTVIETRDHIVLLAPTEQVTSLSNYFKPKI